MPPSAPSSDTSFERHWFFSAVRWCAGLVVAVVVAGGLTAWEGGMVGGHKGHLPDILNFIRFVCALLVPVSAAKFIGALLGWIVAMRRRRVRGVPSIPE